MVYEKKRGLFGKEEIIISGSVLGDKNILSFYKNGQPNPHILYVLVGEKEKEDYMSFQKLRNDSPEKIKFLETLRNERKKKWEEQVEASTNYHEMDQRRIDIKSGK